ncbi:MAG: efflux transporter outer membrane subunit [Alphaproteobacteria bacterium]
MRRPAAILALLATLLAGCPVGPNFRPPEYPVPPTFRGADATASAPGIPVASFADLPWWKVFADPVLQSLIDEAIEGNFDLEAAIARVEQSQALVGVARAPLFPQVGYLANAERQRLIPLPSTDASTFNSFLGAFNLAWELDVWGRIRRSTEAARGTLLASEAQQRGVLLDLVAEVATAYFDLLELDRELEIAHESVDSFESTFLLFQRRYVGGVGSLLQTSRAQGALSNAQAQIPQLEARIVEIENRINTLLGRPPGSVPRGRPMIEQMVPPEIPPGLPSDLLLRRPDIVAAEAGVLASNAQVGVAIANFFPRIGLTSLYGGESPQLGDVVKNSANLWNLVGSLSGPIFTGGQLIEQYRAQVAAWEEAKANWGRAVVNSFAEVSSALVLHRKLVDQRAAKEREVAAYRESVRLALLRYEAGLSNYYEVLEAQQLLFPALYELAQVQRNQLIVFARLYRSLGGGWALPVDGWDTSAPAAGTPAVPGTSAPAAPAAPGTTATSTAASALQGAGAAATSTGMAGVPTDASQPPGAMVPAAAIGGSLPPPQPAAAPPAGSTIPLDDFGVPSDVRKSRGGSDSPAAARPMP